MIKLNKGKVGVQKMSSGHPPKSIVDTHILLDVIVKM